MRPRFVSAAGAPREERPLRPKGPLSTPSIRLKFLVYTIGALGACLLAVGCTSSPETLRAKLEAIGQSDLKDILSDLPTKAKGSVLAKPHFVVDEFKEFQGDTAIVFQAYASLVFFYLDPDLGLCQVRKYRYKTSSRIWDRYEVKLKHIPRKYSGTAP